MKEAPDKLKKVKEKGIWLLQHNSKLIYNKNITQLSNTELLYLIGISSHDKAIHELLVALIKEQEKFKDAY